MKQVISNDLSEIASRIDIAGSFNDQINISEIHSGYVVTISILPTFNIKPKMGLCCSTRTAIKENCLNKIQNFPPELLAKFSFSIENFPDKNNKYYSGAQDSIGIFVPGISRHYYEGKYWPTRIENITDSSIIKWIESHICLYEYKPRLDNYNPYQNSNISIDNINLLSSAANNCWKAIIDMDINKLASSVNDTRKAQIALMPNIFSNGVDHAIENILTDNNCIAAKPAGAGGGGYIIVVYKDKIPKGFIPIKVNL